MTTTSKTVSDLIISMLKENTGKALCDSGDAYGRNWQRNQEKDFTKQPKCTVEFEIREYNGKKTVDYIATTSIYHYLNYWLELDDVCNQFNSIPVNNWDSDFAYGLSTEGEEFLKEIGAEPKGDAFNTYNWDNTFSQIMQGQRVEINDELYVLLQIHGGCDARGGYTDAKLFKIHDDKWQGVDYFLVDPYISMWFENENGKEIISFTDYHGDYTNSEGESIHLDSLIDTLPEKFVVKCDCQFNS